MRRFKDDITERTPPFLTPNNSMEKSSRTLPQNSAYWDSVRVQTIEFFIHFQNNPPPSLKKSKISPNPGGLTSPPFKNLEMSIFFSRPFYTAQFLSEG